MVQPTLPELIEHGENLEISHRTLNADVRIRDSKSHQIIQIPYNAIVNKYHDFFDQYSYILPLTELEKDIYWHNPRLLSFHQYNTTEYWSIILYINECASMLDFEPNKVTLIDKNHIKELVNQLLIIDNDQI